MTTFAICQACAGQVEVHLLRREGQTGNPAGCCVQCQSFACRSHGKREAGTQQFRCIECLPGFLLYSAVAHSGSENELAKRVAERSPAWFLARHAWRIEDPEAFLQLHDLVRVPTGETLSSCYERSAFDLDQVVPQEPKWELTLRDLRRIQFRLDSTPQRDLLKLAAAYTGFLYPAENANHDLPEELQALRGAILPLAHPRYGGLVNGVLVR